MKPTTWYLLWILTIDYFLHVCCSPIQLVYPSSDHTKLLIDEGNLEVLEKFPSPLAVVSVVGPLHSGKSFLLNQLIGNPRGFALGPTIEPKTRGLWVWSETIPTGSNTSIVVLDTEGLFASNVSESYDAKIFAIATLMSSYLIYNSVKFIDQSSIEYLELLARRAQLFGLKSQLHSEYDQLLWVVQDFFQDTLQETPTEWLHRLLRAHHRASNMTVALHDIFPAIECFTVFLPQYDKEKLRYLDQVSHEELLPEYREDIEQLRAKILAEAPPKLSGNTSLSGAGLASLLRALVVAANSGRFPEVPSLWDSFIKLQSQKAIQDAQDRLRYILAQSNKSGPLTSDELATIRENAQKEAESLYHRMIFGLDDAAQQQSMQRLQQAIKAEFKAFTDANEQALSKLCSRVRDAMVLRARHKMDEVVPPLRISELKSKLASITQETIAGYESELAKYKNEHSFRMFHEFLVATLESRSSQIIQNNEAALTEMLQHASQEASKQFEKQLFQKSEPLSTQELSELYASLKRQALQKYEELAGIALELEMQALGVQTQLTNDLSAHFEKFKRTNNLRVLEHCKSVRIRLEPQIRQEISHIEVPRPTEALNRRIDAVHRHYVSKFREELAAFADTNQFQNQLTELEKAINEERSARLKENSRRLQTIVKMALPTLSDRLDPEIRSYYIPWFAEWRIAKVAAQELKESQKVHDTELIDDIVAEFIRTYMSSALASVKWKFWSIIVAIVVCISSLFCVKIIR